MLSFLAQTPSRSHRASENPLITDRGAAYLEFLKPKSLKEGFLIKLGFLRKDMQKLKEEGSTSILLPPYHWHWSQAEVFQVEKGVAIFTIDGKTLRITPADGSLHVPAGVYHKFDMDFSSQEDFIAISSGDVEGVDETFFRNFMSYLDECKRKNTSPSIFQLLVFLHNNEVSLAIPFLPKVIGKFISKWGLGFIGGKVIGEWVLGYKSKYDEYYHSNVENAKNK